MKHRNPLHGLVTIELENVVALNNLGVSRTLRVPSEHGNLNAWQNVKWHSSARPCRGTLKSRSVVLLA
jgi:hypothetical protein